jgi:hypothetical protein
MSMKMIPVGLVRKSRVVTIGERQPAFEAKRSDFSPVDRDVNFVSFFGLTVLIGQRLVLGSLFRRKLHMPRRFISRPWLRARELFTGEHDGPIQSFITLPARALRFAFGKLFRSSFGNDAKFSRGR